MPSKHNEIMEEYSKNGFEAMAEKYYGSEEFRKNRKLRSLIKMLIGDRLTAVGMAIVYRIKGLDNTINEIIKQVEK